METVLTQIQLTIFVTLSLLSCWKANVTNHTVDVPCAGQQLFALSL